MISSRKKVLSIVLIVIIGLAIAIYFAPLTVDDEVTIWLSNRRFESFLQNGTTATFVNSNIYQDGTVHWDGQGLHENVTLANATTISMSEGLTMWGNDSLKLFKFPLASDTDQFYMDNFYLSITNVSITAQKLGVLPQSVVSFKYPGQSDAYSYINLTQVESMLSVKGNETYRLSISMGLNYYIDIPNLPFLSNNPSRLVGEKTVNVGTIEVECINGAHAYANIDYPYQSWQYHVSVPYVKQLFWS
jgi:hypothetical protein